MTRIEQAHGRCDQCGAVTTITPTDSPWEFDWRCPCGFAGTVSWAHNAEPPAFVADGA